MRTISIRIPDSLERKVRALAMREGISVNQVVVLAIAEKIHTVMFEEERAARADDGADRDRTMFDDLLDPS